MVSEAGHHTKKKNIKINPKKFLKRIGFIGFAVYVVITLVSQQGSLSANAELAKEYERKIRFAQQEQEQLKEELAGVNTDEYLERMAREKLGMVKSNERVFIDVTKTK